MDSELLREQLERVIDELAEGVLIVNADGKIAFANSAAERIYGRSKEDIVGRTFNDPIWKAETVDGKAFPDEEHPFVKAMDSRKPVREVEMVITRADDRRLALSLAAVPLINEKDEIVGVTESLVDISERKRLEEEAKRLEANYRAIFDAANDAIFVHDVQTGAIQDVNAKMTEMYGYSSDEAKRLNVGDLSAGEPPYTQEDALIWMRKAVEDGPQLFEWLAKDKKGRTFWVEVNLKRVIIGGEDRLLAIVRDITERKRSEQELKESEGKFKDLAEKSLVGVYLIQDGVFKYVNPRLAEIFGYSVDELIDKKGPKDLVLPKDWPTVQENIRKRIAGEIPAIRYEFKGIT